MAYKSSLISTYSIIIHKREQWNAETSYILRDIIYVYSITYYVVSLYLGHSCAIIAPFSLHRIARISLYLVRYRFDAHATIAVFLMVRDAMEISCLFFFLNKNNCSFLQILWIFDGLDDRWIMKSEAKWRGMLSNVKLSMKIVNYE